MTRQRSLRLCALAMVVSLSLFGASGVVSAKTHPAVPKVCIKHPQRARCLNASGGGTGSGTGGTPPSITVQVDPSPLVETGPSSVVAVIQVETSPAFSGDPVFVSSSQLEAACGGGIGFLSDTSSGLDNVTLTLDNDGNATVLVEGSDCAPGPSLIDADLAVAPFATALTTLIAAAPAVTAPGVTGFPATSGIVTTGEVETGDTAASGDSDVIAVFYVEDNPVYAEQPVEINSSQLSDRCITGSIFSTFVGGGGNTSILDDDGNAVFVFFGSSCAAGPSQVIADVEAGTHDTFTTTFTVVAPQPTI